MGDLLYHAVERSVADVSPFDDAIIQVASTGKVKIVSPYIGISYLERVIEVATDWSLISDVEAWLSSLSVRARPRAWTFIRENIDNIHHCAGIHAKAVIGKSIAVFGSANLTDTGIRSRTELGILLAEPDKVAELQRWYDGIWCQTAPPFVDETSAFVEWLDNEAAKGASQRQKFALAPETRKIRVRLVQVGAKASAVIAKTPSSPTLDLSSVAQGIVERDARRYSTLDEAVAKALDVLASKGFSLGQIVQEVRWSIPAASAREVYFLLLQHCANHPRSVFVASTISRLIVADGIFVQSDPGRLETSLRSFDQYLVALIRAIRFDGPADLPSEAEIERATGISERDQVILVGELLEAGFFELYDLPGELAKYELAEDFDWAGRFLLFPLAKHAWEAMFAKPRQVVVKAASDEAEEEDVRSNYLDEKRALQRLRREASPAPGRKKPLLPTIVKVRPDEPMAGLGIVSMPRGSARDWDLVQAKVLEWVLSAPGEERHIPLRKPGQMINRAIGIPANALGGLLFSNPHKRLLDAPIDESLDVRVVRYKPLPESMLVRWPLSRKVLVKFGKVVERSSESSGTYSAE